MLNVTKSFLPPLDEYIKKLEGLWKSHWLTNNGILVQELEEKLKAYLGVKNLLFTGNGTVVLQMALKALGETGEIITTPFSYVATTNAIIWEGFTPVFVDINPIDFCIDADKIESAITKKTVAIMATHVYGNPCNVEKIQLIADKYGLKVIYDAAHAFGVTYKGKQLLSYGDISTCSFHATKVFHTVEGGSIFCKDDILFEKLFLYRQFGHVGDDYFSVGINGKNSEFHAAMGLCNLPYIDKIILKRKKVCEWYNSRLSDEIFQKPVALPGTIYNYAYYPIILPDEKALLLVKDKLASEKIFARRYFYPSLNELPFFKGREACPVSENISKRSLSLPLSTEMDETDVDTISRLIIKSI
ncbi:MAG: DegT/DnrJ/EryC1/StrS family aminotransferase [Chitinophagaceae bacterium]|nr:DegT/DnrJ/EryC1/StrS family aminotransferase [Chitinophagaceae bacterium]